MEEACGNHHICDRYVFGLHIGNHVFGLAEDRAIRVHLPMLALKQLRMLTDIIGVSERETAVPPKAA